MKKIIILFIIVNGYFNSFAQANINSSGKNAQGVGGNVSYSVGQIFYTNIIGSSASLSQGIQQPYEIYELTSIASKNVKNAPIMVYPNPTNDYFTLEVINFEKSRIKFQLCNLIGKLLIDEEVRGCDFDIVANNGYVHPNYETEKSPSSAVKICWALESRIHVVAVSSTGSALVLETATFCTINGALSNTLIPNKNRIYDNSLALNLINCQSNTFTHLDLELAYIGIKFDQWSIQNTFSAIFVSYCDTLGATFDNSSQVTDGKNIVLSIRSGGTAQTPSLPITQKLFTNNSVATKTRVENFFGF